jgi:protein SCO1
MTGAPCAPDLTTGESKMLHNCEKRGNILRSATSHAALIALLATFVASAAGCKLDDTSSAPDPAYNSPASGTGGSDAPAAIPASYDSDNKEDCLPKTNLLDQNGKNFSMDSLKGKPVLVDFIYTSCPGPCLMLTAKLANVANRLGPDLGSKVALLSITVDPEHDKPQDLLKYSKDQGADENGWTFLTGSPAEVEHVMNLLKLKREHEPDGSVAHVVDMFLIGPDGHELKEYSGSIAKPQDLAVDLKKAISAG